MNEVELLAGVLLEGARECEERGVTLQVSNMEDLLELNRLNADSWRPLLPIFSHRCNTFAPGTTVCWFGRDHEGDVVLAQAMRLFDWRGSSFREEAESLRLFYDGVSSESQVPDPGMSITVTAPTACGIRGVVAYTGAHWVRPDHRGKGLTGITPRMMRALAITAWGVPLTCTIMAKDIFDKGVAERAGYPNHEWTVDLKNTPTGTFPAALLWATRAEIMFDLQNWLRKLREDRWTSERDE